MSLTEEDVKQANEIVLSADNFQALLELYNKEDPFYFKTADIYWDDKLQRFRPTKIHNNKMFLNDN